VLSGEKQRIGRQYDFIAVCKWFAERADMILLLFDAHKLDISDEFKSVIGTLKGHDEKIRVVLNKADRISNQQLMRWSSSTFLPLRPTGKLTKACTNQLRRLDVESREGHCQPGGLPSVYWQLLGPGGQKL
jgi:tRNA U34 5-carboxymethylaminomethyl modifying GTPase MnmE/TrmE